MGNKIQFKKFWFITVIVEAIFIVALASTTVFFAIKNSNMGKPNETTIVLFVAIETTPGSIKITINNDNSKEYIVTDTTDEIEISACPGDVVSISEMNPERPLHIFTYSNDISNKTEIYNSNLDLNYNSTMGNITSYQFTVANTNYYLQFAPTTM